MKINEIRLKGWRSYSDSEEVVLKDLKHINIIIGPNNSGKSNIFKYLYYLRNDCVEHKKDKLSNIKYDNYNNIPRSFPIENTWAESSCNIHADIKVEEILFPFEKSPQLHEKTSKIHLSSEHKTNDNISCLSVKYGDFTLLEEFKTNPKLLRETDKLYINPTEDMDFIHDTFQYWYAFLDSLYFVDAIRHHSRTSSSQIESDFDGSEIVGEIIRIRNKESQIWRAFKQKLVSWLKQILNESHFELDPSESELRFYIKRGEKEIPASLAQLGTGVAQLVMLLSFLYLNKERSLNVFIEEPEGNLHPEAVIQFIHIIKENFKNHRFFITTHSSILIDQVDEDWTVHRVVRKGNQSSTLLPCSKVIEKYEILDQLGIKASQLLQSNLIIWIEGPSDRIYINKWIKDHTPSGLEFIEGRHYSFLMYGGANLTSFDILSESNYIDILSTSRYAIVVCDSDKKQQADSYKSRVQKLVDRVHELTAGMPGHESSLSNYLEVWITEGREIENYIPHELFERIIKKDEFLRKRIKVNDISRNLVYTEDSNILGQYDSFDEFFAKKYKYDDNTPLSSTEINNISSSYSQKKVLIAQELVNEWGVEDYGAFDLKEKIDGIIKLILRANGMQSLVAK
ncbi:ATP-dependent nuclease [Peribacillus phoenicis]|uniref:ATP-dependent nuclease n=1 Tax=unclassified Peribacillus TaxID=2675266 RepID=UPI0039A20F61